MQNNLQFSTLSVRFPYQTSTKRIFTSNFGFCSKDALNIRYSSRIQKFSSEIVSEEKPVPEVISSKAFSGDLISPYALKAKDLSRLHNKGRGMSNSEKIKLPSLPSNFKLRKLETKRKQLGENYLNGTKIKISKRLVSSTNTQSKSESRNHLMPQFTNIKILESNYF